MRCKVVMVQLGGLGAPVDLGDEVTVVASEAQAFVKGRLVAKLVNAQVVLLWGRHISIEGFAPLGGDNYERRAWWCEVGAENEGAK